MNPGHPIILLIMVRQQFVVVKAFVLQAFCAEVEKQANRHVVGFEVVYGLRKVNVLQLDDGFEFDHDDAFHEEVHPADADLLAAIEDGHFFFAFEGKVVVGHFEFERALVDDLLEAIAEGGVDFHSGANDAPGDVFVEHGMDLLSEP